MWGTFLASNQNRIMCVFGWDKWQLQAHQTELLLGSFCCFNVCPIEQHLPTLQHHLSFTYHGLPVEGPFKEAWLLSFLILFFFVFMQQYFQFSSKQATYPEQMETEVFTGFLHLPFPWCFSFLNRPFFSPTFWWHLLSPVTYCVTFRKS